MPSTNLLEAVAVTAELCGRTFSEPAARVFVADLSRYPEDQVIAALGRCRREVRGILTVADVVGRIEDGRPGVEQAWAMLPVTEAQTAVWTDEMATAFGSCEALLRRGDTVAARMAFKEAYQRELTRARDAAKPVSWWATIGDDKTSRRAVLEQAVSDGRLPLEYAQQHVPELTGPSSPRIANHVAAALAAPTRKVA